MAQTQQAGQTSINIPQLLAVALVGFLAIRWYLSKPNNVSRGPSSSSTSRRTNRSAVNIDTAKVAQLRSMFPQLARRSLAWDLQRNGGNVAATTERVLGGRALETPPATFWPQGDEEPAAATAASTSATANTGIVSGADLITRYGLQGRVGGKGKQAIPSTSEERKKNEWAKDKNARAEALRAKRNEMILEARRKMEARDRGE